MHQGKLNIYGWIYEIETGEILAYNPDSHAFEPPQSHLYPEDRKKAREIRPGGFDHTNVPPIVASSSNTPKGAANGQSSAGLQANWLTSEQSDRIYRGTAK